MWPCRGVSEVKDRKSGNGVEGDSKKGSRGAMCAGSNTSPAINFKGYVSGVVLNSS